MDRIRKPLARLAVRLAGCALFASASTMALAQFDEGRLDRVQALKTPRLDGTVPTYYTPGYRQRARDLQRFVVAEMGFAQRREMRTAFPAGSSPGHQLGNAETLRRLEKFSPGLTAWAAWLETRPRRAAHSMERRS